MYKFRQHSANEYLMLMAQIWKKKSLYKQLDNAEREREAVGTEFEMCRNTMPINNRILALFNQIFWVQSLMFIQSGAVSLFQPHSRLPFPPHEIQHMTHG